MSVHDRAQLGDLVLPGWLPGEQPPVTLDAMTCFTPGGVPMKGDFTAVWSRIGAYREDFHLVTEFPELSGDGWAVRVSTVYLGLNHGFTRGLPIRIFETLVFDFANYQELMWRYSTWPAAQDGHRRVVALLEAYLGEAGVDAQA